MQTKTEKCKDCEVTVKRTGGKIRPGVGSHVHLIERKTEHTPTPWQLEAWHGRLEVGPAVIKDVTTQGYTNAEFIIRACNAHDELVEALKEAYYLLHYPNASNRSDILLKVEKTIAKVEEN